MAAVCMVTICIATGHRGLMSARKLQRAVLAAVCGFAAVQTGHAIGVPSPSPMALPLSSQSSASPPANQTQPQSDGSSQTPSSSTETVHRKTGANSSETIRHTHVVEQGSPSPEVTQAEDFIQKRDYAAAEPLLVKATATDPANYVAWFDLGFAENGLGKTDESIAAYRKSVIAKADVFESNLNLGIQLAKAGQPDAEQFLRAATQLTPTSHVAEGRERAWLSLAHVLEAAKPEEATAAYQRAAALQPKDPEPHLAAAQLLDKQEKFSDAESEYKQALALDPSSDALTGLANIYMRGRKFPEAEQYLRKLVETQPSDAAAHIQLGRVLAAEGKNDAAVSELQSSAKLVPNDLSVQRDLADLYAMVGKNAEAEAAYRTLVASHPKDAELHRSLGESLLRQKKFADAQQEFLTTINLKPDSGDAYGDLAFAASENKNYPLTLKALEMRAKYLPENPLTYFLRASAYDHLKDVKQAMANYHLFLNVANGKYPDQEWQAKHRLIALEPKK
jgi:Flp pilus assembly protein TadD